MNIIKIYFRKTKKTIINKAVNVLKEGGVVVYPTDTAYGIGVDAFNEIAIRKLYKVKGRNFSKPTHVIVPGWRWIEVLTFTNENARKLYENFLPGPLTLILNKKPIVPDLLTGGLPTLGVRIPDCKITRQISQLINLPYTTPSANRSGGKAPYSIKDVKSQLDIKKIDLILDAGELPKVPPSTIVDLTTNPPEILREGPITKEQLEKSLGVKILE